MRVQSFLDCGGCRGSYVAKFLRSTERMIEYPLLAMERIG